MSELSFLYFCWIKLLILLQILLQITFYILLYCIFQKIIKQQKLFAESFAIRNNLYFKMY